MELSENSTAEVKNTSKTSYLTIDEKINRMKITFNNATLPGIYETMETVGYTTEKLTTLNTELTTLERLHQARNTEQAEQQAESAKFDATYTEVDTLFTTHRKLTKILFKTDVHAQVALQLTGSVPMAFASWLQHVQSYYNLLSSNTEIKPKVANIGITEAQINKQLQTLKQLEALRDSRKKETAEAQAATDARDKAFDHLYPQYSDYIKYAKVLLPNNQQLEALGIIVK